MSQNVLLLFSSAGCVLRRYFVPVCAAALLAAATAPAAIVAFRNPVVLDDNGAALNSQGNILVAVNFSTNPVRVAPFSDTNPNPNPLLNGIQFTGVSANTTGVGAANTYFFTNAFGTDQARTSGRPATAAIYPLIYDNAISANNSTPFDLTLRNLTVGLLYDLQLIFSSSQNRSLTVTSYDPISDVTVTSNTVNYGIANGPILLGVSFVADGTTQMFRMNGLGLNNRTQLSGFVLTQPVPEPSTLAMAVLGVALAAARRFRR